MARARAGSGQMSSYDVWWVEVAVKGQIRSGVRFDDNLHARSVDESRKLAV
jgi:hypothetical protein